MKCKKCKTENDESHFISASKMWKTCLSCRTTSQKWREKNKSRVHLYNKFQVRKKQQERTPPSTHEVLLARKSNTDDEWVRFESAATAAKVLNVYPGNISHVLNGKLKTTGGYVFKRETESVSQDPDVASHPSWEELKEKHGITDKVVGQPSPQRKQHESRDGTTGKECCTCKEWRPLMDYNASKTHWDSLRSDCKHCLVDYRRTNRQKLSETMKAYEKKRKAHDPVFKLTKTLRSRLGCALRNQSASKSTRTFELTGCSILELKQHLESKFQDGMTWENHGEWHVDHIRPCASFNLTDEAEQRACFHFSNLQPYGLVTT